MNFIHFVCEEAKKGTRRKGKKKKNQVELKNVLNMCFCFFIQRNETREKKVNV